MKRRLTAYVVYVQLTSVIEITLESNLVSTFLCTNFLQVLSQFKRLSYIYIYADRLSIIYGKANLFTRGHTVDLQRALIAHEIIPITDRVEAWIQCSSDTPVLFKIARSIMTALVSGFIAYCNFNLY